MCPFFVVLLLALSFRVETSSSYTDEKQAKVWHPYILGSYGVHYCTNISTITQGFTCSSPFYPPCVSNLVCSSVLIGSTIQGRDIVMHPEMGLVSLGSRVMWSQSITENISGIPEGSTWGFTMLTTMCFQFSMLNI